MTDHGIRYPAFRLHVVPAVLALATPSWQREVWLDPRQFESLDYTVHVLFDDFCDADDPEGFLGVSLRTREEVELMRELGAAYGRVADGLAPTAPDIEYLGSPHWPELVAIAARLAQVMVTNDQAALTQLHEAGHRWPPESGADAARPGG